jgi:hypothetical protein
VTDGGSSPRQELNLGAGRSYIQRVDAGAERARELEARIDGLNACRRLYGSEKPAPNPPDQSLPLPRLVRRSARARKLAAGARRRWTTRTE